MTKEMGETDESGGHSASGRASPCRVCSCRWTAAAAQSRSMRRTSCASAPRGPPRRDRHADRPAVEPAGLNARHAEVDRVALKAQGGVMPVGIEHVAARSLEGQQEPALHPQRCPGQAVIGVHMGIPRDERGIHPAGCRVHSDQPDQLIDERDQRHTCEDPELSSRRPLTKTSSWRQLGCRNHALRVGWRVRWQHVLCGLLSVVPQFPGRPIAMTVGRVLQHLRNDFRA